MRWLWLLTFFAVLLWSAIAPKDYLTWLLEVFPALIGLIVLIATRKTFPLTPLLYGLILLHSLVLMVGGHYTYAEVPLFDIIKPWLGWQRNNYDKLGHFTQGFVPALIAREILIRKLIINGAHWRNFLIVCVCLALSATYELIEWLAAIIGGGSSEAFLGTQGDVWDTQTDMAMALAGAICALLFCSKWHDRQLRQLLDKSQHPQLNRNPSR